MAVSKQEYHLEISVALKVMMDKMGNMENTLLGHAHYPERTKTGSDEREYLAIGLKQAV